MTDFTHGLTSFGHPFTWLAWILLHSLWQGAAVAALLWAVLQIVKQSRSNLRYCLACAALVATGLMPVVTGFALRDLLRDDALKATIDSAESAANVSNAVIINDPVPISSQEMNVPLRTSAPLQFPDARIAKSAAPSRWKGPVRSFRRFVDSYSGIVVFGWMLGVAFSAIRLLSSFRAVRTLRRSAIPVSDADLMQTFVGLMQRYHLDRSISLKQCADVAVPTVLGWLRPVVLIPLAWSSQMSLEQIEALLAHELAHIKRHDYLVNLWQTFIETVLFYHPSVWWISNTIRDEREHCCDAIALCVIKNHRLYVDSLLQMARAALPPELVLSAGGGNLKARIERILGLPSTIAPASGPVIVLVTVFLMTMLTSAALLRTAGADDVPKAQAAPATDVDKKKDDEAKQTDAKASNDVSAQLADKPAQVEKRPSRINHGSGGAGTELFLDLRHQPLQKELGLNDETIAKIKVLDEEFRKEFREKLPINGLRSQTTQRERGPMVTTQEATPQGCLFSKL